MKQLVKIGVAVAALGVLANARPASACDAHQKTTTAKSEKAQPDKAAAKAKQAPKGAKAQQGDRDARTKSVASAQLDPR